jgi:hypothetical protein
VEKSKRKISSFDLTETEISIARMFYSELEGSSRCGGYRNAAEVANVAVLSDEQALLRAEVVQSKET